VDWIAYIKEEEEKALKEIYDSCRHDVLRWLVRDFSCSNDEAMDVFQTSVVIMYDNVVSSKLSHLSSDIKSYIKAIARNKALELIRSKSLEKKKGDAYKWIKYAQNESNREEQDIQLEWLSAALDELGDPCKGVLTAYYYENKNMDDITHKMGYKNADTTKNQKYKCLKRLQKLYFGHIGKKDF
jgi:RNA polymerase sigma factor (sigma-70 family)